MYSAPPNVCRSDLAPQPSTRYDQTHWQTGLLASNFTTSSAASKRRRRHLQEQLERSLRHEELLAAQLEAHRRTTAIRRALREEENNGTIALSPGSPRRPSPTASNRKQPQPQQQQPAPASRTLDSTSAHKIATVRPDSDTLVLKHESTRTQLTPQRRYVSPPTHIQQQRAATPLQVHVHPQVPDTMTETATLGQITQPAVAHASARKSPTLSTMEHASAAADRSTRLRKRT